MAEDKFEWRDLKAEKNAKSHGITFDTACRVFADQRAIWDDDSASSWDEDRFRVVGLVDGRVIIVSYTYREDDVIRLISARQATKRENDDYYRS